MEIMTDLEYAKWCLLNELDRLAIPDELRKQIEVIIEEELANKDKVCEKATRLIRRR